MSLIWYLLKAPSSTARVQLQKKKCLSERMSQKGRRGANAHNLPSSQLPSRNNFTSARDTCHSSRQKKKLDKERYRRTGEAASGGTGNIVLKRNEELLNMKAEAGGERNSMAVWEGKKAQRVRLWLKKDDSNDRDPVWSREHYTGRCLLCTQQEYDSR